MTSAPELRHLVLCRNREATTLATSDSVYRVFEEKLLESLLRDPALPTIITAHLYDLKDDGPTFRRLRTIDASLIVLSWLPARATGWRLRGGGLTGAVIPVEGAGSLPPPPSDGRAIWCLDMHDYSQPENCAATIRGLLSRAGLATTSAAELPKVESVDDSAKTRWYPVIDYDRCVNCLECLNFCLFGVFGLDETEAVRVEQPDACRPGCPACARVCPSQAIMFPEHADPTISGRATKATEATNSGMNSLPMLDPLGRAVAERNAARGKTPPHPSQSSSKENDLPGHQAGLDDLIDEVDNLDL